MRLPGQRFLHSSRKGFGRGDKDSRSVRRETVPSREALQMVTDLRRAAGAADSKSSDALLKARCSRMVRFDYITVLQHLLKANEIDTSLKVFDLMRNERWYKPSTRVYELLMDSLFQHRRMDDWKRLLRHCQDEGLDPLLMMFVLPFRQLVSRRDFNGCMEFYEAVKEFKTKVEPSFLFDCIEQLSRAEQPELADTVLRDFARFNEEDLGHIERLKN